MNNNIIIATDYYKSETDLVKPISLYKYLNGSETQIKTHLVAYNGTDNGITGFFDASFLLCYFKYNEAYIVSYEKDYGDGQSILRSYLAIVVDSDETVEHFRNIFYNFNRKGEK